MVIQLAKYKLNLQTAGIFFYGGEEQYSIQNIFQELVNHPFDSIRLSKERYIKYQYIVFTSTVIAAGLSIFLAGNLIRSLFQFNSDFKNTENKYQKMLGYNSSPSVLKYPDTIQRSCEIIHDAYELGGMSHSYAFIPSSWKNHFPTPILGIYSFQFSSFFNKNFIHFFNKTVNDTILISSDSEKFDSQTESYSNVLNLTDKIFKISSIYSNLEEKNPEIFHTAVAQIIALASSANELNKLCSLNSLNNISKFPIINNDSFNLKLSITREDFLLKSKAKFEKTFESLLNVQFSRDKLSMLVLEFNNSIQQAFETDSSSHANNNEEKLKSIKSLVESYHNIVNYTKFFNETTPSVEEFIAKNNYNKFLDNMRLAGVISEKDKEIYKSKIVSAFKAYQIALQSYDVPVFREKLFAIDHGASVSMQKDISFFFSNLSRLYYDYLKSSNKHEDHISQTVAVRTFFNNKFIQEIYSKTSEFDSIIVTVSEKKYSQKLKNKIQDKLNYILEMDIISNKDLLFTDIPESNLNLLANGEDEIYLNLLNAYKEIRPLDIHINKYKLYKIANLIYPQVYVRINRTMENNITKLFNLGLYSSNMINFNTWNGETSPAQIYFSVFSESNLSDYLNQEKLTIAKFYTENTEPVLQIHNTLNKTYKDTSLNRVSKFWQGIKNEVIDKTERGSLTLLNDFILNTMDKTNLNSCNYFLKTISTFKWEEFNYFGNIKYNLARNLGQRCEKIYIGKSISEYNLLARDFNNILAGKFPFIESKKALKATHFASIDDVKSYTEKYEKYVKNYLPFLKEYYPKSFTSEFKNFIFNMNAAYDFINFGKDKDGVIRYPVSFEFRSNRVNELNGNRVLAWKIETGSGNYGSNYGTPEKADVSWKVGDPLKAIFKVSKSKNNKIIGKEIQDIIVDENNPWGLLTLLMKFRDCTEGCYKNSLIKLNFSSGSGENVIVVYFNYKIHKNNNAYETIYVPFFPFFAPEIKDNFNSGEEISLSLSGI